MPTPSGPAGGDLGATYPDPTVVSLSHVTAGGDLSGQMDAPTVTNLSHAFAAGDLSGTMNAPTVTNLSHVTAAGDLSGTMNAPTVTSIANVIIGPAVYPAGDGSQLTNTPPPANLQSGSGILDGNGMATVNVSGSPAALVAMHSLDSAVGVLYAELQGAGQYVVASVASAADAGRTFFWIAY